MCLCHLQVLSRFTKHIVTLTVNEREASEASTTSYEYV